MKIILICIISIFFLNSGYANDQVTIFSNPGNPVKNESFKLIFKIKTSSGEDPYISFNPGRAEVLNKENKGYSIQTTIINGKVTTKREVVYEYELLSDRAGSLVLKDIKVDVDGKTIKKPNLRINILTKAKTPKNLFMVAIPSKTTVFLGEGIDVRYYMFYRVPIVQQEVKSFPKLNGFIKRFHKVNEREETVQYNGGIYKRSLKYSARLYPEKTGKIYIDPMALNIQYATSNGRNSPLGSFGFGFRQYKSKTIRNKRVEILVNPLPVENVPNNFTGLIGPHEFKLEVQNSKVLVNEAVELRLTVEGPGALENYPAPQLYYHDGLEEFDTKSEMIELGPSVAKKVFDYTYLPREPLTIQKREMKLSYYDPEKGDFVETSISLPELISGGKAMVAKSGGGNKKKANRTDNADSKLGIKAQLAKKIKLIAPIFQVAEGNKIRNTTKIANMIATFALILLLISLFWEKIRYSNTTDYSRDLVSKIRKEGLKYGLIYKLILELGTDKENVDPVEIINDSKLSKDSKNYFLKLIKVSSNKTFGINGKSERIFFKKKYFNELLRVLPR